MSESTHTNHVTSSNCTNNNSTNSNSVSSNNTNNKKRSRDNVVGDHIVLSNKKKWFSDNSGSKSISNNDNSHHKNKNKSKNKNNNDNSNSIGNNYSSGSRKQSGGVAVTVDRSLPVFQYEKEILSSIESHKTTVIVGETGSGKSTQIPKFIQKLFATDIQSNGSSGSGSRSGANSTEDCVVCTQPRRVATVTIAQRVAAEMGEEVGGIVGYGIRFEEKASRRTKIKFVTDGVLLREFMADPTLKKYKAVVLDEAHERSLQTDILMGLLKQLQQRRKDLKIVIMSATLQAEDFMNYFDDCSLVTIPGRQYPVHIFYAPEPEPDFIDAALITCLQVK